MFSTLTLASPLTLAETVNVGEGRQYRFEPSWTWASWLIVVLVLLSVGFVIFAYLQERGESKTRARLLLASVRILLIGMVFTMMLGWVLHRDRTDLPDLVIVIDDSQSMSHDDHFEDAETREALLERANAVGLGKPTRINLIKTLFLEDDADLLESLQERYNVKIYHIGGSARADGGGVNADAFRTLSANEPHSRLGKGLRDVLEAQRGRPTAAVIVLTDGITTEGQTISEVAQYARRKAVPLFTVGIGNDASPRDVRLSDLLVNDVVFVNDIVHFDVQVTAAGYQGKKVAVKLMKQGDSRVLVQRQLILGDDDLPSPVRLEYRPDEVGEFEYVVEVEPQDTEVNVDNNGQSRLVSVRDATIRVLLVQGYPSYEFRRLRSTLGRQLKSEDRAARQQSIDLTVVLQEADVAFADADDSVQRVLPVRREELNDYDVIIFGDVDPSGLGRLEMENLADFVKQRGGGMVFIAGPRYTLQYRDTPLAGLLPIDLTSAVAPHPDAVLRNKFLVHPTQLGLNTAHMQLGNSPAETIRIWQNLEGVYWLLETPDLKDGARVLAKHPLRTGNDGRNLPLIAIQYVGAGKVLFHATDETHRWRYRMGDKYFARYWIQTIRYLSRAKLLGQNRTAEITTDRKEYRRGEPVLVRARFFDDRLAPPADDGVTLVLESEDGQRSHVTLHRALISRGIFEGTLTDLAKGDYRIWMATPTLEPDPSGQQKPPFARFNVVPPLGEQARLEMNSADLQLAAETSQGKFYTIETADDLVDDLPPGRQEKIGSLPPLPIWSLWQVALVFGFLFVVLITIEWLLRKRLGML